MGVRFYFDNGLNQLVPGASIEEISRKITESKDYDNVWLRFGNDILINAKYVIEIIRVDSEDTSED